MKTLADLSDAGRQELALAILLWKDFKADGKFDTELIKQAWDLADMLGVRKELDDLARQLPPFQIKPR